MTFVERERFAKREGSGESKMMPVFYRLSMEDCRSSRILGKFVSNGDKNPLLQHSFFERVASGAFSVEEVVQSLGNLGEPTGV